MGHPPHAGFVESIDPEARRKEGDMQATSAIEEPKFARFLFTSPTAAWIWLVARVWLGYQWLHAGWEKITGTGGGTFTWHWAYTHESWLKSSAGLKGFVGFALKGAGGGHASVNYGWYAAFLRWIERSGAPIMSPMIAIGEFVIGAALILGLFTGIAAFFGGLLNFSFGLSGVAGVNPVFFVVEVLLVLAWRNAGYYGLDRYVLPALGTPWQRGKLFRRKEPHLAMAS
jgi:thiosulfate dehydrogenase [quinone] large subunit